MIQIGIALIILGLIFREIERADKEYNKNN